jgi:hypothetical protein
MLFEVYMKTNREDFSIARFIDELKQNINKL